MANLDPRFICTSDLDTYYVDNASGLPLSGGIVTFYSDINRTTLKPVYQLTGTPGNYSYAPLNNPCTLSSAGTFQDALGNNIVPYYYPFTGTPADNTGVQELYYIKVVNSGLAPQFTRQGWPQAAGSGVSPVSDNEIENFIPNGQFLSHNNIVSITEPPVTQYTFDAETVDGQAIAQGGWYFVYTDANTAVFSNSFSQIPASGGWGINSFPKFVFNFSCTSFNATALTRDLRIQWPDINKFSSGNPPGDVPYTLFFDAKSNDGNTYTFSLYRTYYFGTGGSPSAPTNTLIGTFTVGPSLTLVSHNIQGITFPANQGTIGTNGDDYVGLSIRGPASAWNAAFSDFALIQGNETLLSFPVDTNAKMLSQGVAGFMPTPDPNGQDLYLPLILTPKGMTFDRGQVGDIVAKGSTVNFTNSISTVSNELIADGSQYLTSDFSPLGIPYARLGAYYISSGTNNTPLYGTGFDFATTAVRAGTDELLLLNNRFGSGVRASDVNTGFTSTFNQVSSGLATTTNVSVFRFASTQLYCQGSSIVMADGGAATGIVFTQVRTASSGSNPYTVYTLDSSAVTVAAMASTYFTFTANAVSYYIWFKYNGTGTDPAPGGAGIEVDLYTGYTPSDVIYLLTFALLGGQGSSIVPLAGSAIVANSYFQFTTANANKYYVWYSLDDAGTDPKPAGGYTLGIKVVYTALMTTTQVATATRNALNNTYFAVPDLQGFFLRGYDPNNQYDLDAATRFSVSGNHTGNVPGTFEFDQFLSHVHQYNEWTNAAGNTFLGGNTYTPTLPATNTTATGGKETRPVNANVVWVVKY